MRRQNDHGRDGSCQRAKHDDPQRAFKPVELLNQHWKGHGADEAGDNEGGTHDARLPRREAKGLEEEVDDGTETDLRPIHDREDEEQQDEVSVFQQCD